MLIFFSFSFSQFPTICTLAFCLALTFFPSVMGLGKVLTNVVVSWYKENLFSSLAFWKGETWCTSLKAIPTSLHSPPLWKVSYSSAVIWIESLSTRRSWQHERQRSRVRLDWGLGSWREIGRLSSQRFWDMDFYPCWYAFAKRCQRYDLYKP